MKGIVKSATLSFSTGVYDIASICAGKSAQCDAVEVSAMDDTKKRFVKGALTEENEFTVTLYQGSSDVTVGTNGALTISITLSDGSTSSGSPISVAYNNVIVTAVKYPDIDATGDRKATYEVTFKPDGSVAATTGGL